MKQVRAISSDSWTVEMALAELGHDFKAGGDAVAPAHMNHFAWTKTGATIQVNLIGPFDMTYVNPADDPRGAKGK